MSAEGSKVTYAFLLVGLALALGVFMVYSDRGLVRMYELQAETEQLKAAKEDLREQNRRLVRRIERIRTDRMYIEDEVRRKLGLVRSDEIIYRLGEEPDHPPAAAGRTDGAAD